MIKFMLVALHFARVNRSYLTIDRCWLLSLKGCGKILIVPILFCKQIYTSYRNLQFSFEYTVLLAHRSSAPYVVVILLHALPAFFRERTGVTETCIGNAARGERECADTFICACRFV